jgi:DNA-binding transcriptional MerR regulator
MAINPHTLADLTARTGFSPRQIRYYISRQLVPGAGGRRGPAARYGDETLRRLLAIARLKDHHAGPTGRRLTLDEMAHLLDSLDSSGIDALISGTPIPDLLPSPTPDQPEPEAGPATPAPPSPVLSRNFWSNQPDAGDDLHELLGRLRDLLEDLSKSPGRLAPDGEEHWRRVKDELLEIHVRQPASHPQRLKLAGLARAVGALLDDGAGRR